MRCVCVGARTIAGGRAFFGLVKDWAGYSYEISGYEEGEEEEKGGPVWGDGITPLASALGLPGAAARVELEVRPRSFCGVGWGGVPAVIGFGRQPRLDSRHRGKCTMDRRWRPGAWRGTGVTHGLWRRG